MTTTLVSALDAAEAELIAAGIADPRRDVEEMAACALGVSRSELPGTHDLGQAAHRFADMVRQRKLRVPLQHLVGRVQFRRIELLVGPGVFVPQPETESVVQWAVAKLGAQGLDRPVIVDLCTGSGTIALAMANEVAGARVHAVEKDPGAFAWASRNVENRFAAGDPRVEVRLGDAGSAFTELDGTVDMVTSNPPYVADSELGNVAPEVRDHDPRQAIQAGADGLDIVRIVERTARRLLRPGGVIVVEHSDRQGVTVPQLLEQAGGWSEVKDHRDHDGLDRFVTATWAALGGRQ
jgi:release factor glutamine methyltransferase